MGVQGFDNHIQREIFMSLRQHDVARYTDIHIKTIESSQFMYHLKELIKAGLVEKVDKGRYRLTRKGIGVSQNFSSDRQDISPAPLTYTLIFARSKAGRYLVLKRNKQPYINLYACVSGKVHMDETLENAARREWADDTQLPEVSLAYQGQVSVMIKDGDQVLTHIAGAVWFVDNLDEQWDELDARIGSLRWEKWQELPYDRFIPGWKEIVEAIDAKSGPFMLDLSFTL